MYNRLHHSKMITNSLTMVFLFYVILTIASQGLLFVLVPYVNAYQLLFIPILLGYFGMIRGIFNLSDDPDIPWKNTNRIAIILIVGGILIFLSQISLIIAGYATAFRILAIVFTILGNVFHIISGLAFAVGFFLFRKELKPLYFDKFIAKYPNYFISIGYVAQSLGIVMLFTTTLIEQSFVTIGLVFSIIGFVLIGGSVISLAVGFYPLFISFRAFPKIMDAIAEGKVTKKKSKKAS